MKKAIATNKIYALVLASLLAGNALLCSCDSKAQETTTESATETEITTEEETTTTGPRWETTAAPENPKDTTPYEKITLDGSPESTFISTDFCYIESEKYVLLLDRDIKLPGDFVINVDAIINEIEKQLGVPYNPDYIVYDKVTDWSSYYDKTDENGNLINPWEGWDIGTKIPIFLVTDREDEGRIPCADSTFTVICDYAMFSDDLWNSIPSYRDNAWRRDGAIDYGAIAHELTHTIAWRNCDQTDILSEGLAQYMEFEVLDALKAEHPSVVEYLKNRSLEESNIPQTVNAKNAEQLFIDDYHTLSHADRGAQYYFGQHFWQYLYENCGNDCFVKYRNNMNMKDIHYNPASYKDSTVKVIAGIFKDLYGDDVFSKFGNWCVKNNYLQNKNY